MSPSSFASSCFWIVRAITTIAISIEPETRAAGYMIKFSVEVVINPESVRTHASANRQEDANIGIERISIAMLLFFAPFDVIFLIPAR